MKGSNFCNKLFRRGCLVLGIMFLVGFYSMSNLSARTALADANTSYVRVIHASPYVGTADVFVDGKPFLNSFQFAAVTDYAALPAGNHKVQIALVGKGVGAAALTKTLPVEAGKAYTIAAVGATPQSLDLQVFIDDNKVVANQAKVRVYHLIPDAGQVNVSVGEDNSIKDMTYEDDSQYLTVDTGPCNFSVTVPLLNVTLSIPKNLQPNTVTSIFAVGMVKGNPKAQLVTATTQGIPGLPQTGAAPVSEDFATPTSAIGLLAIVLLLMAGLGTVRYFQRRA
ncbi:DUF4397 domain-containing protein [Dictyobacter kobayashii]|uniref:Cell wall anchor n=1 Tax=Dictyobacter kobayashii TaxID=2014872 RepID=A0A402AHI9_9CHLR|nr:DUF4397 domain-containing protein [Dictyobacter kobayashii]GCE18523.1 cell wall anchor [Dictyobacter kobayashii]